MRTKLSVMGIQRLVGRRWYFALLCLFALTGYGEMHSQGDRCDSCAPSHSLENNWGLAPSGRFRDVWPEMKYQIHGFDVSPDEKYIVYLAGRQNEYLRLLLKDLNTGEVAQLSKAGFWPQFSPDSRYVLFKYGRDSIALYSIEDGSFAVVSPIAECDGKAPWCVKYWEWAPDSNLYAAGCGVSLPETGYHRFDVRKFPEIGCGAWTQIDEDAYPLYFPPDDLGWAAAKSYRTIENVEGVPGGFDTVGFIVTTNIMSGRGFYREKSVSRELIEGMRDEWYFSRFSEVKMYQYPIDESAAPSSCGSIYMHLSVRSVEELVPPPDGSHGWYSDDELRARSLCGWYRVDTGGREAIQVARTWNNYGAIVSKVSGDLFYGRERQDSTSTIMRTDNCSYGRQIVVTMEDDPAISSADGQEPEGIEAVDRMSVARVDGGLRIGCVNCRSGNATVKIYSLSGELVANEALAFTLDGADAHGFVSPAVPTGIYLVALTQDDSEIGCAVVFLSNRQ